MSEPLTSLVKKMDERVNAAAGKHKAALGTYFIFNDRPGLADQLRNLAKKENLKRVSLAIGNAPPRYEVSGEAEVTVVIYSPGRRRNPVTANFAFRQGELDDEASEAILEALTKVLPK
jgi:hypothetical protein